MWLAPMVAAAAPGSDTLACPPLVVVGGDKKEAAQFDGVLGEVVRELGLSTAPWSKQKTFLGTQKAGRCVDNDCLDRLARFSDAGRALLVSVAPFSRKVTLAGKIIYVDGTPPKLLESKEFTKKPKERLRNSVKRSVKRFLAAAFATERRPAVAGAVVAPPSKPAPSLSQSLPPAVVVIESPSDGSPPAEPPVPYDDALGDPAPVEIKKGPTGSGQGLMGKSAPFVGGVGLAGLVLGTVLQLNANASWANFNELYAGQALTPSQLGEVKAAHDRAKSQQTGATIFWAVGGTAVAGGTLLFLLDPPWRSNSSTSSEARTGLTVTPSGVTLSGVFQ